MAGRPARQAAGGEAEPRVHLRLAAGGALIQWVIS